MPDLYESAIAGAFLYDFGWRDRPIYPRANLLLNAQNPLDALLGDLIGELQGGSPGSARYFIVEFKQRLNGKKHGFDSELKKTQRTALHHQFARGGLCHDLGLRGHFGVWYARNALRAAPYVHALLNIPGTPGLPGAPWPTARNMYLMLRNGSTAVEPDGYSFTTGLGLTERGILRYLACMFSALGPARAAAGSRLIAFGQVTAKGDMVVAQGDFTSLEKAFERYARVLM